MKKIKSYFELLKRCNTLELKYSSLKEQVKNECFKTVLNKIGESDELIRLRDENKRLRLKIKELRKESLSYVKTIKK